MLYSTEGFPAKASVVPAWYNRPGYLSAMCELIAGTLKSLPEGTSPNAHILYSAQARILHPNPHPNPPPSFEPTRPRASP